MATYQDIKGLRVKYLSADPSTLVGGDVWYNSTSGTLKGVVNIAAWSSASPMNTARRGLAGIGTQTASLGASGYIGPTVSYPNVTEEYNGSGWTNSNNVGTARDMMAACGTQTAGLIAGGRNPGVLGLSEEYDGSTWTEGSNLNTDRGGLLINGAGTQTAGLAVGGFTGPSGTKSTATEEYGGTTWVTSPGSLTTGRSAGALFGIQSAAVAATGEAAPGNSPSVEEYDGSTWTAGTVVPTPAATQECSGLGTATDGMIVGGTEEENLTFGYDGTTWSALPNLATGRYAAGAAGTTPAGILFGGAGTPPVQTNAVEEFNKSINTVTGGAWASGAALPGTRGNSASTIGSETTALGVGGQITYPNITDLTEEYNGTAWSPGGVYPGVQSWGTGSGTVTAGWFTGGITSQPNGPVLSSTNTYNGTSWTAGTAYPGTILAAGGTGPQTAGLAWGGLPSWTGSAQTTTFEYSGPAWTAGGTLPMGVAYTGSIGTQTAALSTGGGPPGKANLSYNGTGWTVETELPGTWSQSSAAGTQTSALAFLAGNLPVMTNVLGWDGTSWSTRPSLGTGRYASLVASGNTSGAIGAGGYLGPPGARTASTEEFTGETSVATASTLTTS